MTTIINILHKKRLSISSDVVIIGSIIFARLDQEKNHSRLSILASEGQEYSGICQYAEYIVHYIWIYVLAFVLRSVMWLLPSELIICVY